MIQVSMTPFPKGSNFDPAAKTVAESGTVHFESIDADPITVYTSIDGVATTVFGEQEGSDKLTAPTTAAKFTLLADIKDGTDITLSVDGASAKMIGSNGKLRVGTGGSQDGLG